MTGRKTLQEIREQLAAARAEGSPLTDSSQGRKVLEALDRLAEEIAAAQDGDDTTPGEPRSLDEAGRTGG